MSKNKTSIIFICPFFGHVDHGQFQLWLKSISKITDIHFSIYTDDCSIDSKMVSSNVSIVRMTWQECQNLFSSNFSFPISIENPYKICDYRPAFGEIFSEDISGYDFWGHMDITDTIIGNLRNFLTESILSRADKIHVLGHLMLYRNTPENNARYKCPSNGLTYYDVFTREENMCFDDLFQPASINRIYREKKFPICERIDYLVADILPFKWSFWLYSDQEKVDRVFEWNKGSLYELTRDGIKVNRREIGYVHFQKRKMENHVHNTDHFYIVPNKFIDADHALTAEEIHKYSKERMYFAPFIRRIRRIARYMKTPKTLVRKVKEKVIPQNDVVQRRRTKEKNYRE